MAASGTITKKFHSDNFSLVLDWSESGVSAANNTSSVTVTATLKSNASGAAISSTASKNISLTINGTTYSSTCTVGISGGGSKTLMTKTVSVAHDSDGSKTIAISCTLGIAVTLSGTYYSSVTASGSAALTTIARASSVSAESGTLGTAQALTVTRYESSFTHTIKYACGSASGTICTKSSDTSISWAPPLSLAEQNTTGSMVSITLTITTYDSDGDKVGSAKTETFNASIPSSVKPSCTVAVTDAMGYADTYGAFVKGLSKFKVEVTPTLAYGSPIDSYSTTANGSTYTDASFTTGVLKSSGDLTVQATVKDKRGRSGSGSKVCSVYDYAKPSISSLSVKRCNADGSKNSSGAYLKAVFSAGVTSLNEKNTAVYTLSYRKSTETNETSVPLTDYAGVYAVSSGSYIFEADTASSYIVVLTVADDLYSGDTAATKTATGSAISKLWSVLAKGKGIAFGKIAELSGYLDVGFETIFRKHITLEYDKSIYGINADGEKRNVFKPFSSAGNTIIGYSNYENADANTNIYGKDINLFVASAGNVDYKPYYAAGDSISVNFFGAGLLTSSKAQVRFTLPLSKPIIGSSGIAVSADTGFVLRQAGNYTHGSAASTYVVPESYDFTVTASGIRVKATFSDTTDAVNNDTIGVEWVATLTLSYSDREVREIVSKLVSPYIAKAPAFHWRVGVDKTGE